MGNLWQAPSDFPQESRTGPCRVSGLTSHLFPQLLSTQPNWTSCHSGPHHCASCSALHMCSPLWLGHHCTFPHLVAVYCPSQLSSGAPSSKKPALILHAHGGLPLGPSPSTSPPPHHWHTALSPDLPVGPPTGLWAHGWRERALLSHDSQHAAFSRHRHAHRVK